MISIEVKIDTANYTFIANLALIQNIDVNELIENLVNREIESIRLKNPHLENLTILI